MMKTKKKALITGITGQDGSYLAEFLLEKGYEVHGIVRRVALEDATHRLWRIKHLTEDIHLHTGSIESYASVFNIVEDVSPDECYHLAAQSFVNHSFDDAFSTVNSNINGTMHVLSAIQKRVKDCRLYFAGSSEMFGLAKETPQSEETPFRPRSPYGISKVAGFEFTRNYRDAFGLFACSGIMFNHESPRRGFEFVTRKISSSIARLSLGIQQRIHLGNLGAFRDWGFAGDYVKAMWLMLQQEKPDDYVIGSGEVHSVREFVNEAFRCIGVEIEWQGEGLDEKAYVSSVTHHTGGTKKGDIVVDVNPLYFRPSEADVLQANYEKSKRVLKWKAEHTFKDIVHMMVKSDIELHQKK